MTIQNAPREMRAGKNEDIGRKVSGVSEIIIVALFLVLAQAVTNTAADTLLELGRVLSPQPSGFDVSRAFVVGAGQHRDDGE